MLYEVITMRSHEEEDEVGVLGLILLEERAVVPSEDLVVVRNNFV